MTQDFCIALCMKVQAVSVREHEQILMHLVL